MGRHRRDPVGALEPDEGRVDPLEAGARLERPGEHLVHVDRARDLAEKPAPATLLLGPLDRAGELLGQLVHPLLERLDDRADALVGPPARAPADDPEQGKEQHEAAAEGHDEDDERLVVHRREVEVVAVWSEKLSKAMLPRAQISLNRPV